MNLIEKSITSLELLEQINHFRSEIDRKAELLHKDLLKIIRDEFEEEINEGKFSPVKYQDKKGESRPMFNLTLSQAKQVLVRESKYVRRAVIKYIEELERKVKGTPKENYDLKAKRLEIMEKNANVRLSNQFVKLAKLTEDKTYKEVLVVNGANCLSNKRLLELPQLERKTFSATEIGNMLGVSANKIGKIANKYNLKTDKFGKFYHDKAKHCDKHISTFRYYENAIVEFKKHL